MYKIALPVTSVWETLFTREENIVAQIDNFKLSDRCCLIFGLPAWPSVVIAVQTCGTEAPGEWGHLEAATLPSQKKETPKNSVTYLFSVRLKRPQSLKASVQKGARSIDVWAG